MYCFVADDYGPTDSAILACFFYFNKFLRMIDYAISGTSFISAINSKRGTKLTTPSLASLTEYKKLSQEKELRN